MHSRKQTVTFSKEISQYTIKLKHMLNPLTRHPLIQIHPIEKKYRYSRNIVAKLKGNSTAYKSKLCYNQTIEYYLPRKTTGQS